MPEFAAFVLLDDPAGRDALACYYRRYLDIAAAAPGAGFILESPTWRASSEWGAKVGSRRPIMGIFDRIFGGREAPRGGQPTHEPGLSEDEQAIARYRYMLRTAPPETIEQAHAEAFAKLTPDQRRKVLDQLSVELPGAEAAAAARMGDNPAELARVATRAEVRQPGTMERVFGRLGGGAGMGGILAGTFLGSIAGTVVGSMIAQNFLGGHSRSGLSDMHHPAHDSASGMGDDTFQVAQDDAGGGFDAGGSWDV